MADGSFLDIPEAPVREEATARKRKAVRRREPCPATLLICASWVVVYLAMALHQGTIHANARNWISGGIQPTTAFTFGSLVSEDVARGQVWRAVTATFLHFSLVHLLINTLVMYQLGREVEPWYGPWNFLGLYVLIGGFSNLLAAALRPLLAQSIVGQSGGGSGVICGLIGMIAVIGWRERSRFGNYILGQMAIQLVFIGLMGVVLPNVDNLVHASGALVGAFAAALDRTLQRNRGTRVERATGILALAVIAVSAWAQAEGDRADRRSQGRVHDRATIVAQEMAAMQIAQGLYLRLCSAQWPENWLDPMASIRNRDRLKQLLVQTIRTIVTLDAKSRAIQSVPQAALWLELAQMPLRVRPDPGTIHRFLELQHRVGSHLRREEVGLLRRLGQWESKIGAVQPPRRPKA